MFNKPTLFVNSVYISECGKENQKYFDSRRSMKSKVLHRIDDIVGFISYGKRVFIYLSYLDKYFYGEVIGINYNYVILKVDMMVNSFSVNNINEIKITSLL